MVFDCCGKKEKSRKIREKLDELLKDTQGKLLINCTYQIKLFISIKQNITQVET